VVIYDCMIPREGEQGTSSVVTSGGSSVGTVSARFSQIYRRGLDMEATSQELFLFFLFTNVILKFEFNFSPFGGKLGAHGAQEGIGEPSCHKNFFDEGSYSPLVQYTNPLPCCSTSFSINLTSSLVSKDKRCPSPEG
jgi:hypothetical protein